MGQNITIKIDNKSYPLTVESQEQEHYLREAALKINEALEEFKENYKGISDFEKMLFVALNNTANMLKFKDSWLSCKDSVDEIKSELISYIESLKK